MDSKWRKVISTRTSNEIVRVQVADFFAGIADYDDPSDFQGIKSGLVRNITDLAVGTARHHNAPKDSLPFQQGLSVLALMSVVGKHKREFPHLYRYSLVPADMRVEIVCEDGCRICELVTPEAIIVMIDNEVGDRFRTTNPEQTKYWAVIGPEGDPLAVFATSSTTFDGIALLRKSDFPVQSRVLEFIRAKKMSLLHPCALTGLVESEDGTMHSLSRLPDGVTINGSLCISRHFQHVSSLPNNMTVKGDLIIDSLGSLLALPEHLTVFGDLRVTNCVNVRAVGGGSTFHGDATFYGNASLQTIGPLCSFEKDLTLDHSGLLSQKFNLKGDVWIGASKDARRVPYPAGIFGRVLGICRGR